MKAVFLSDAHLKRSSDPGYRALMSFLGDLRGPDEGVDASDERLFDSMTDIFLVGDIFEFWFSKGRRVYPEYEAIVGRLEALKRAGIDVHLCEGNHDFFLKDYFSVRKGMHVYEDWAVVHRDDKKLLIGHGDLVDRNNLAYLRLRKMMRSRFFFCLQRLTPLSLLWGMARWSSSMSKEFMGGAEDRIFETMHQFADDRFQEGYDAVILGHCHKAQIVEKVVHGRTRTFVTLGDWLRHYSYLLYANGKFTLTKKEEKTCFV